MQARSKTRGDGRHEARDRSRVADRQARRVWIAAAVLVAVVIVSYLPALEAGFIWDDDDYVVRNETLRDLDGLRRIWFEPTSIPQYYPLVHTTFWIERRLFGLDPAGYHATNVLLHAVVAVLLFLLLRRLEPRVAFLAAALFALHPVQVESVVWITERKNVLSGVFYLLAFHAWLRWRPPGRADLVDRSRGDDRDGHGVATGHGPRVGAPIFYWLALAAFVAALLSKTVTCSLPAAMLLVVWWQRGRLVRGDVWPTVPFFALGLALAAVTATLEQRHVGAAGADWDLGVAERILIAGRALWFYAGKLVWPVALSFNYRRWAIDAGVWWQWLYPASALAVVMALVVLRRRLGRGPLVAVLFFGGTLVPALGFFDVYPMLYSFVADHFQYLASIGLMVLGAALLRRGGEVALARICARREGVRRRLLAAAAVVLCATLGLLTRAQTRIYDNTQTLWSDTLAKNPDSWLAAVNLGGTRLDQAMLLEARGDAQRARAFYREARRLLERSLAIRESNAYAHNNLGMVLMQTGETAAAREQLETAIRQRPDYAEPYNNLGVLLWRQGKLDAAAGALERALELKDDYVDALRNLGFVANEQGRADRAIELMRQVLALRPTDLRVRVVLADLLRATGRPAEALTHYRFVLRQEPGHEAAARGAAAAEQALRAAGDRSRPGGR